MSIFTRRHYAWLASAMRDAKECTSRSETIEILASALAAESPGFHRELFLHNIYCDPTSHTFGDSCPFAKS